MKEKKNEKPFVCETCDKAFKKNQELKQHNIIHTNVKPFVCETCDKAFKSNHYLKLHKVIHANKKW